MNAEDTAKLADKYRSKNFYTWDQVIGRIESSAKAGHESCYFTQSDFPEEFIPKLKQLGYEVYKNHFGWSEERADVWVGWNHKMKIF